MNYYRKSIISIASCGLAAVLLAVIPIPKPSNIILHKKEEYARKDNQNLINIDYLASTTFFELPDDLAARTKTESIFDHLRLNGVAMAGKNSTALVYNSDDSTSHILFAGDSVRDCMAQQILSTYVVFLCNDGSERKLILYK